MIGGETHDGVFKEARILQRTIDAADVMVHFLLQVVVKLPVDLSGWLRSQRFGINLPVAALANRLSFKILLLRGRRRNVRHPATRITLEDLRMQKIEKAGRWIYGSARRLSFAVSDGRVTAFGGLI